MNINNTIVFDGKELKNEIVKDVLNEVYDSLKERGYDPITQLLGYLISDDIGYISNYKDARKKIQKIDREQIVEVLLNEYLKDKS